MPGPVELTTLKGNCLCPAFLERDDPSAVAPAHRMPGRCSEVRPFGAMEKNIVEGSTSRIFKDETGSNKEKEKFRSFRTSLLRFLSDFVISVFGLNKCSLIFQPAPRRRLRQLL